MNSGIDGGVDVVNSDDDDNVDGDANSDIGGGQVKSERFMRR